MLALLFAVPALANTDPSGIKTSTGSTLQKQTDKPTAEFAAPPPVTEAPKAAPLAAATTQIKNTDYAPMTLTNIMQVLVRMGGIDLTDDAQLDEYALMVECSIFSRYMNDEFQWRRVREKLREQVMAQRDNFPTGFELISKIQLDKYDFDQEQFLFAPKSVIKQVNAFRMAEREEDICVKYKIRFLPNVFWARLDEPFSLSGIPMSPQKAETLVMRLNMAKNIDRIVYARILLSMNYVEPLVAGTDKDEFLQKDLNFESSLEAIEFYEDEARTRLIWTYSPYVQVP